MTFEWIDLIKAKYISADSNEIDRFSIKYAAPPDVLKKIENQEKKIRFVVDILYHFVKRYNIIRACSESGAKKGKGEEKKAVSGFHFCQDVVSIIDRLKADKDTLPLHLMIEGLILLGNSIAEEYKKNNFADEIELIFQMFPANTVADRKMRDEQYNKFRTGMSEILKSIKNALKEISLYKQLIQEAKSLGLNVTDLVAEEANVEKFAPTRAPLSVDNIVDFIRQHGMEYGIQDRDDWGKVMVDNSQLRNFMTTVINAINRGHVPKDKDFVKQEISRILSAHDKPDNLAFLEE